jgi:CRP-like cAMP-binding protein
LTRAGAHPSWLYFLLEGAAAVKRSDSVVTELSAGFFVGEMSLITGRPANADVDAVGEVRVHCWTRKDLTDLRARDLGMWTKVLSAIGADLVQKIQRGEARLAEK